MKVSGTSRLSADRDAVWRALTDPSVLVRTIPGCQQLEALGGDAYKMTIAAGVGSIKGVYDGHVRLTDQEHPGSFRMHAQGAGAPGTIGAEVLVTLMDHADGGTELTYDADATVGGMIGGVGQRMLTGVSKKMATEFFGNVDLVLTGPAGPGPVAPGGPVPPALAEGVGVLPGTTGGPAPSQGPSGVTPGTVFTAPGAGTRAIMAGSPGFLLGVAVGAAAALAGAVVGGWLAGRRRS
ncbi:MAG: SRPBCC family protein [Nocardioidaceae bacterium]